MGHLTEHWKFGNSPAEYPGSKCWEHVGEFHVTPWWKFHDIKCRNKYQDNPPEANSNHNSSKWSHRRQDRPSFRLNFQDNSPSRVKLWVHSWRKALAPEAGGPLLFQGGNNNKIHNEQIQECVSANDRPFLNILHYQSILFDVKEKSLL